MNLGTLAQSRFILAHLGLLVSEHHGHSLSLLLNSGVLALSQSILRLVGKSYIIIYSNTIDNFSSIHKEGFERDLNAVYHSKCPELFWLLKFPPEYFYTTFLRAHALLPWA